MEALIPLSVVIPLGVAFAIVVLAHIGPLKRTPPALAVGAIVATLAISLKLLGGDGRLSVFIGNWGGANTLGIEMACDGLSRLMLLTINMIALAAIVFSISYMRRFTRTWLFYALFLLMVAGMNGVVLAADLFNLYVFLEMAAIASYALVGFGCEADELEAAFKYLVLGTIGSTLVLMGIAVLYSLTGQLNMAEMAAVLAKPQLARGPAVMLAAAGVLAGLGLKAAMVPFHAWLPDAHPAAPAPISAMLSGVVIKALGVYAMARVVFNVFGAAPQYATILVVLGTLSMVIGVFLAIGQWDFKRLLAYHSISQMGYVVLALGVAAGVAASDRMVASVCLFGGLYHMFNHAAFKSLLFLSSGSIEQYAGSRQLKQLGGLTRRMPVTSFCCRIGALSISGVPPFNGFFSKLIIIVGLALAGRPLLAALAAFVALMTLLSFVKVQRYALEGEPAGHAATAQEAPLSMRVAMIALAVVCVAGGLAVIPLWRRILQPAAQVLLDGVWS